MPDSFNKSPKLEHEPIAQESIDPLKNADTPLSQEFEGTEPIQTKAAIVVDEFSRTIEFQKFLENILRDMAKVEVEINPEDDPEVWMAMNRIFSNPNPSLNQDSYYQVLDALEAIERIESSEDNPRGGAENDFLSNLPDIQEVVEGEIKDEDFQISAVDEIEAKSQVRRSSAFRNEKPVKVESSDMPTETPLRRRWQKLARVINVLGKPYKVQWLVNRWWRKDSK